MYQDRDDWNDTVLELDEDQHVEAWSLEDFADIVAVEPTSVS